MRSTVEMKEKRLLTIEEKLNARERVSPSACSFLLSKCSMSHLHYATIGIHLVG